MKIKGIGICEWSLPIPMRGPVSLRLCKEMGLSGIELELGLPDENYALAQPYVLDLYKEYQSQYGISITGVAANLTDFYQMTLPDSHPEKQIVKKAVRKAIDCAQALSAPLIHVPSFTKSTRSTASMKKSKSRSCS